MDEEEEEYDEDQSKILADIMQRHAPGARTLYDPNAKKPENPLARNN